MKTYYITFRSVTYAQRGERVLRQGGIGCAMQRTPKWMEQRGCGYCLQVSPQRGAAAVEHLRRGSIPFRGIYAMLPDGNAEEVVL